MTRPPFTCTATRKIMTTMWNDREPKYQQDVVNRLADHLKVCDECQGRYFGTRFEFRRKRSADAVPGFLSRIAPQQCLLTARSQGKHCVVSIGPGTSSSGVHWTVEFAPHLESHNIKYKRSW